MTGGLIEEKCLRQNALLAALPTDDLQRLAAHLEPVEMPLGKVLYESGGLLEHGYFPADSIVSLLYVMRDGASAEVAVVGCEGMLGVALFMGGHTMPNRAIVQSGGSGFRIAAASLLQEFRRAGLLQHLLLRYAQALMT